MQKRVPFFLFFSWRAICIPAVRVRTIKPFPLQSISLQPAIQARLQINGEVQLRSPCVPGCKEKIGVKTPPGPQIDSIPELTAQAGRPAGSCCCRGERSGRAKFLPPCANALRPAVSWLRVTVYFPNNLKRGVCILFPCVGPRPPRREVEVRCRFISAPAHVETEAFHHTHTHSHTLVLSITLTHTHWCFPLHLRAPQTGHSKIN